MAKGHKNTRRMHKLRDEFKAECADRGDVCWICTLPIDYSAPGDEFTNDDRFQLDHYFAVSTHPDLQEDPANFRPSHAGCNRDRGAGATRASLGIPSQEWT